MSLSKLILGPPGSGKTTMLMFYGKKEADAEPHSQQCLCIGSIMDSRSPTNEVISTHNDSLLINGDTKNIVFIKLKRLKTLLEEEIAPYDIILIDEGHFFTDLIEFVDKCIWVWHKIVMVAGIASDVDCRPLGNQICGLLPFATEPFAVVTLAGRCGDCMNEGKRGDNAQGSYVKIIGIDDRENQIKVAGLNTYRATCAPHHPRWLSPLTKTIKK